MIKLYRFVLFIAPFLVSCGGDESGSTNSTLLDLEGRWVSNCYSDGGEDLSNDYSIDEFIFSGSTIETSSKTWNNVTCSGSPYITYTASGTYSIGNTITTASGLDAVEVNFLLEFQGREIFVLDIIRQDGDMYYYGVFIDSDTRPTELDFNVTLTRQ